MNKCETCAFFKLDPHQSTNGECRIDPPKFHPSDSTGYGQWPKIHDYEGCGKHKSKFRKGGMGPR